MSPRTWLSVPLGRTCIRIGRSVSDTDWQPKLPGWRKYELAQGLREAATRRGEHMTREHSRYLLDKARATGELDERGNPVIHIKGGNAGELARQIVEKSAR